MQIAGASVTNSTGMGITFTDDLSFDMTDNVAPFGVAYIGSPYVYGKYSTSFFDAGWFWFFCKINKNIGVLKILINSTYPAQSVRYTYPDVVNDALRIFFLHT